MASETKKRWAPLVVLAAGLLQPVSASALPYVNPKCAGNNPVSTPKNGKGVYFSEDCRTAYVEPPVMGKVELRAVAPTQNLQFCTAISNVDTIAERTINSVDTLSKKLDAMVSDYQPLDEALQKLRAQAEQARLKSEAAEEKFKKAESDMEEMKKEMRQAADDLEECKLLHGQTPEACDEEAQQAESTKKAYVDFRLGAYRDLRAANDEALEDYNDLNARLTEANGRYSEAIKPMLELWTAISDLNERVFGLYRQYAGLNGATGQLVYSIDWNGLIESYEKANPKMKGRFQPIPIREGLVWGSVVPRGSQDAASIPAILSAELPGLRSPGVKDLKGEAVAPTPESPSRTLSEGVIASASGQVVLTLNGACPFFNGPREVARDIPFENLAAYLVVNTTFTYEVAAKRGYEAKYHLSQLMSRFERKAKRGGFFSSKSVHEVIEDNRSDDWFKFKTYSEDSQYQYTDAQEQDLKKTVKAELIDRALRQMATFNGTPINPPGLIAPPMRGATAVSYALRRCPFWYCQAGSLVFGVLDSIFGRSEAVSIFKRNNNVWVTEEVEGVRMVDRSSTVTFAPETQLPGGT